MKKYFEVLRTCPLFIGITDENLVSMLGCLGAVKKQYQKGETIFAEGEKAEQIGLLLSGKAQILREDYYGNRSIVTEVDPADLFGEAFACAEMPSLPIAVVATEDSEVLLIDCRRITNTCCNACTFHAQMIFNLLKIVARKNILLNQRAEIISKRSTREKLLAYLTLMAKQTGSNYFTVPFDRQELSDYLEVDRSGLSAEISKLRAERILECHKSDFKLL